MMQFEALFLTLFFNILKSSTGEHFTIATLDAASSFSFFFSFNIEHCSSLSHILKQNQIIEPETTKKTDDEGKTISSEDSDDDDEENAPPAAKKSRKEKKLWVP